MTETKGGLGVKEDISLIEHLDFGVECDYKDCTGDATHRLICPKCSLFEFMCAVHAKAAIEAPKGSYIIFDKSCTHRVDMYDCGKEPI